MARHDGVAVVAVVAAAAVRRRGGAAVRRCGGAAVRRKQCMALAGGGGLGCGSRGSHLDEAWPCFFMCRWFTILAMAPTLRLVLRKSALTEDSPPRSKVLVSKFQSKS
jgi:hypothetical protein